MTKLSDGAAELLRAKSRSGSRGRYQRGWVELVGERQKRWKGHYYTYEKGPDGGEHRVHRAQILGLKSEMGKKEAERKLHELLDRLVNQRPAAPSAEVTWRWFAENRCFPMWRAKWKASHAARTEYLIRHYVVKPFEDRPLSQIDRFALQVYANELATRASRSVVQKFVVWTRAICEEAVEQDYMLKNPARKLEIPPDTRAESRRALSVDEVQALLAALDGRDALILRMYLVLGLRARELFALRRDDVEVERIRVDESLDAANRFHKPKTPTSKAWLWLPPELSAELRIWLDAEVSEATDSLLFVASNGAPIRAENWRKRVLQVAAEKLGLQGVTIQALRRTCATLMNQAAGIKDVQSHLRHARPDITAGVYVQEIPASVRAAVGRLADLLSNKRISEQS